MMKKPFEEKQKFTQWWLWLIMIVTSGGITLLMGHGVYTQLVAGQPWGDEPLSDEALIAVALLTVTVSLISMIVYYTASLDVRIDEHTISYRFPPLIRNWRRIDKDSIASYRMTDRGLRSLGIRFGLDRSLTLTVRGNSVLELNLTNNRTIRLGTQLPDEIIAAVNSIKSRSSDY